MANGTFKHFNGIKYRLHKNGYYFSESWGREGSSLHRDVWEYHNGPIPEGCHVHHKDHDPGNCDIDNLELMSSFEHLSHHAKLSPWVGSPANLEQLREAGERAKAWHASEEGRKVHRRIGRESWKEKPRHEVVCQEPDCQRTFTTPFPSRARYCCSACKERSRNRRNGVTLRPRRKH